MSQKDIIIYGAAEHNLKNINVTIPRNSMTIITGLSGSGKSTLAFDTIYAEGQRRYVESLSAYARQFLEQMPKPHVERIEGLSPAIAIEQKSVSRNPRSTVATVTELYDYLRLLYASIGSPHCPVCGKQITKQTVQQIVDQLLSFPEGTKIMILAPVVRGRKGEYADLFKKAEREGFTRVKINGSFYEFSEELPSLNKNKKHHISIVVDRIVIEPDAKNRLTESVELALKKAEGIAAIEVVSDLKKGKSGKSSKEILFSESFACIDCGVSIEEIAPRLFSFNSPYGACPECKGLGHLQEIDENLVIPDPSLSLEDGAINPWPSNEDSWMFTWLKSVADHYKISLDKPWKNLPRQLQKIILYGTSGEGVAVEYKSKHGTRYHDNMPFEGVIPHLRRRYRETASDYIRDWVSSYFSDSPCTVCKGNRLRPEALAVRINGINISEYTRFTVKAALEFLNNLSLTPKQREISHQILKELNDRLGFLINVGLDYLTLERTAATLSGGEAQRIRLATQIGSQLTGVLYILDEPSIGLHHRDNRRLIETLKRLRDLGNTVIVVEHDEETIRLSDYVVDLGPGAGKHGGYVVCCGPPAKIVECPESLTGRYLSGRESIPVPKKRRSPKSGNSLWVRGAREHNLKDIDVEFPLGLFICITGVSGSGKSTLLLDILYEAVAKKLYKTNSPVGAHRKIEGTSRIDHVINVNQSPIGRTPRSNPATYTKVFDPIRNLFSQIPESRIRGYHPGRFSFNVKGGRCEACEGAGVNRIEMHFLPDVFVECESCRGKRFNRETLEIVYKGKNIDEVLNMTVREALEFFHNIPAIRNKLQTLDDVGLSYIQLGQRATTLSGGEAQRVKLSRELSKRNTGRTLYILDEPTTGLHFDDIKKLLNVLNRLVESGSTIIVIEHNLDVIKCADWIIDLGPEGGDAGGEVLVAGHPETIVKSPHSYTGMFLKDILK
jgi:excinuclease ABC subunit A